MNVFRFCIGLTVIFLIGCSGEDAPGPASRDRFIFWTSLVDGSITRATLLKDTAVMHKVLYDSTDGLEAPSGLAVDESAGMLYWTDFSTRQIVRAPWDGSGKIEVLYTVPDPGLGPEELALDVEAGMLYWTQPFDDLILRAPASRHGRVDTLYSHKDGINGAWGIDLQLAEGYLYWIEFIDVELYRAPLSGGAPERLYAGGSGFLKPYGLALGAGEDLFIADNAPPGAGQPDRVLLGSIDGTRKLTEVYTAREGFSNAYSLKVDVQDGYLFWHNQLEEGAIYCGATDGSMTAKPIVTGIRIGQGLAITSRAMPSDLRRAAGK